MLAAHDRVAAMIAPHMPYMDIHNTALRIEAEGLISLGLMRGTAEDAVAAGAMTLFMPHGLGHGMGLDVHDCEAIGERSFDFSEIAEQAAKSGTCIQRSTWRIEPGTVMTDEPGIYFIPALIDKCRAEGKYKGIVDYEALDAYHRDLSSEPCPWSEFSVPELIAVIREERERQPSFETDGYGSNLPAWLISKEQLIWNIWVCALYSPASARPLLVDSPDLLASQGYAGKTDVITELAQTSFLRYTTDRIASQTDQEYASFASLPPDLRDSSIAYISSIHSKLETLGYEVLPAGSCYPERCVAAFTASEVECLAILEHRRWLRERQKAGWRYGTAKDVERRRSPYMVPWEELPDRAREWNRSAVRSIPSLLASVNLAVEK